MSFAQILLLAVGLAMDATAVAAARGCASVKNPRASEVLELGLAFGFAQGLMPWLGALLGSRVGNLVAAFDHWIAFVVLGVIGGKMLHEALTASADDDKPPAALSVRLLIALAVATSIDAFAVGLTLPLLGAPLLLSVLTIGVVTALLSGAGVLLGRRFGSMLGKRLDAFGGVVLIALGCKILFEHLSAAS
ncbi:MAG TPA: manganese efflux pump MntP family protein [Polyangiales bacterium]|nr:manganese efflux pump MntP family protein [Polyangiales bacterium]